MINFRTIFNPNNTYIGFIIILAISLIIIIIRKDIKESIYQISKTCIISSIITLIFAFITSIIIDVFMINSYKVFIEVITKNILSSIYFYSIVLLIISGIINLTIKYGIKES